MKDRLKIMLAVPSRDVWKSDFGMSFAIMCAATVNECPFIDLIFNNAKGSSLAMNRIKLCRRAVETGCDYILFLDDDMRIPMQTIMQLVKHQVDIIGANCARRELPPAPTAKGFDNQFVYTTKSSTGLEEVRSVGTGVMLIKCDVFAKIDAPWFCEDPIKEIGEDVHFCNQARAAGLKIWIDHDLSKEIMHIGEFEYRHQIMPQWQEDLPNGS